MILLGLVVLFVCVTADGPDDTCDKCEFSIGGIGYLPGSNCRKFIQCRKGPAGWIDHVELCCPKGTKWNQMIKNCDFGHDCEEGFDGCPQDNAEGDSCLLWADEDDQAFYFVHPTWDRMMCAAGTVFRQEICGCAAGYGYMCYQDPLLHFPFAYDFNDIQCPKAAGMGHGDASIDEEGGYMRLDGDGDYMTFAYLNNLFEGNSPDHFALSVWIKQTAEGFDNGPEGIYSNGNCHEEQTVWLMTQNETAGGGISAWDTAAFPTPDPLRNYFPPGIWCNIVIRYNGPAKKVSYFLNGVEVDMKPIEGDIRGTMSDSSVGLGYIFCDPYFFTGCIDDLMVFVREVSNWEIYSCVYGNGRTPGKSEKMYSCPEHQPMQNPFD